MAEPFSIQSCLAKGKGMEFTFGTPSQDELMDIFDRLVSLVAEGRILPQSLTQKFEMKVQDYALTSITFTYAEKLVDPS